jgi:anti-sigma B factor antagonist
MAQVPPFECRVERDGDRLTCRPSGELDLMTAPRLWDEVRPAIGDPAAREMVLDLAGLDFVDSSGVHLFVDLRRVLEERGGRLEIVRPQKPVHLVLRMMGLDDLIVASPDERG